jgi:elongation factor Ts
MVEVNSETDFVARNESFQAVVRDAASAALEQNGDAEKIKTAKVGGATIADKLTNLVATIGENMGLRRGVALQVKNGVVASYVHSAVAPGLGKIGVLVAIESTGDAAKLQALGKQIAMHVAAANPQSLSITEVDPASLKRERDILTEQAMASGRPANVIEKMVEGRLRKFYEETVLLEQLYVVDGESRVSAVVEKAAKEIGAPVTIAGFRRFALGEGIERKESDFAAEVAAQAQIGR